MMSMGETWIWSFVFFFGLQLMGLRLIFMVYPVCVAYPR